MAEKTTTKHNIGLTHREVLAWLRKAAAKDELRAAKGLYLRKTAGGAFWVYRYESPVTGKQIRAQLWADDERGVISFPDASLDEAMRRAAALRARVADGIDPVLAAEQARVAKAEAQEAERQRSAEEQRLRQVEAQAAELAQSRRITVRQAFDRWRATDLQPALRADGTRSGRKDGGQFVFEQFTRHVFPIIGDMSLENARKSDFLAVIDAQKAKGQLRTASMLLGDLKQLLAFALDRELIPTDPLASVKKARIVGTPVERDRVLSEDEIGKMVKAVANARMHPRNATAIWLTLATGVRVGELMGAVWASDLPDTGHAYQARLDALHAITEAEDVKLGVIDLDARTWYMPDTKNERDHLIHLSDFALMQLEILRQHREVLTTSTCGELSPWLFPATDNSRPVCVKSFGKQLADRQRKPGERMSRRTKATTALAMPGGKWTAHDLRRTAGTLMSKLGISGDVIDECLNHKIESRVRRIYVQDRREADQVRAFDALGLRLAELTSGVAAESNVVMLRGAA